MTRLWYWRTRGCSCVSGQCVEAKRHRLWRRRSSRVPMRAPGPLLTKPSHTLRGRTRQVWWHRPCIGPHQKGASTNMHNGMDGPTDVGLEVYSTCTQSTDGNPEAYVQRVADVARWSEQAGCKGILVYSDNRLVDAWLASHIIIQNTTRLCPLVAVQPIYMHPYAVAKLVASFGHLHGRRIYLNMVAGGFKNDLTALNDTTPHDRRYHRLVEYTTLIRRLLSERSPVDFQGEFYRADKLKMSPPLPVDLFPGIFMSGSAPRRRPALTGWCHSRTTRRCAPTWWGAMSGCRRSSAGTPLSDTGPSSWTCPATPTSCTTPASSSIAPSTNA